MSISLLTPKRAMETFHSAFVESTERQPSKAVPGIDFSFPLEICSHIFFFFIAEMDGHCPPEILSPNWQGTECSMAKGRERHELTRVNVLKTL